MLAQVSGLASVYCMIGCYSGEYILKMITSYFVVAVLKAACFRCLVSFLIKKKNTNQNKLLHFDGGLNRANNF